MKPLDAPVMKIQSCKVVSRSGNIALYPALAMSHEGCLGLAWYEYGSPNETDRSDVMFSSRGDAGTWSDPLNVSDGISYNNGPSLIWMNAEQCWRCAWHSWRPPGREPFIPGGDVTNIWLRDIAVTGSVQRPVQALSGTRSTEYASLATLPSGETRLLYHDRVLLAQCLTSADGNPPFLPGESLPASFDMGAHADIALGPDGSTWVAYAGKSGGIYLAVRDGAGQWHEPRRVDVTGEASLTRPKLSLCDEGRIWLTCHSNTWGSRKARYRVHTKNAHVSIRLESSAGPGNHCWTCNAITLRGMGEERQFSFGPDVFDKPANTVAVTAEDSLYDPSRGYGFDRRPRSQLRKLGDDLTRGLFYDDAPAVFRVDTLPGNYEIEVTYSSWIAPSAGTAIAIEAEVLEADLPAQDRDAVFVICVEKGGEMQSFPVSLGGGLDENRPSRVVHDVRTGARHLAWTRYGPDRVEIVCASFTV